MQRHSWFNKFWMLAFAAFAFVSCEKVDTLDDPDDGDGPIDVESPLAGESTIIGVVYDMEGNPMPGVNVSSGASSGVTNAKGRFQLDGAPEGEHTAVDFELGGYMSTQKIINSTKDTERLIFATMKPLGKVTVIDAADGGAAEHDGMIAEFEPNSFVTESGEPYTGDVDVSITFVPTSTDEFINIFPGDFEGIREDGTISAVESYGFADITITGDGEELKLANGKTATLNYPINTSQQAEAPQSIPLWYYDFDQAAWIEEGAATRTGNMYEGEVSHFTPWNVDIPIPLSTYNGRVVDGDGNPIPNALVEVTIEGRNTWGGTTYADINGNFSGRAIADREIRAVAWHQSIQSQIEILTSAPEAGNTVIPDLVIDTKDLLPGIEAVDFSAIGDITSTFFLDCGTGWAVTSPMENTVTQPNLFVLKTIDGGTTWTTNGLNGVKRRAGNKSTIKFRDENFGVITSSYGVFITQDGGENWELSEGGMWDGNIWRKPLYYETVFGENNSIYIYNPLGSLFSYDMGETWESENNISDEEFQYNVRTHTYGQHIWIFNVNIMNNNTLNEFRIYYSSNKGKSWYEKNVNYPFAMNYISGLPVSSESNPPFFSLDENTHYACAEGKIYKSTDNFSTWEEVSNSAPVGTTALFVLNESHFAIGTKSGGIFTTINAGSTWQQYNNPKGTRIYDLFFCDINNGIATGGEGSILQLKKRGWLDL
jgi:photosystem II stability/assembly factor-like uncharacterized protein